jgi:valyl-tRNA synthetase
MSLSVFQRLLAPFLPFVCEEVWSWWQEGSVHRAPWPEAEQLATAAAGAERNGEEIALAVTADVLREVRKAKSQARRPMRAPVLRVVVRDTPQRLQALELGSGDLLAAGAIELLEPIEDEAFAVEVELAPEPSP